MNLSGRIDRAGPGDPRKFHVAVKVATLAYRAFPQEIDVSSFDSCPDS